MSRRGRVTHVTPDGLTTDLGQSQVLAVTERLQSKGWECTVLSLEPQPLDRDRFERVLARTEQSGIRWRHQPYRPGRAGAPRNALGMTQMIRSVWNETDLFHCRSYFGAFFPAVVSSFSRTPFVFDTRGYWVDEKIEAGRWFQDPVSRAVARRVERELYSRASAVVSLTELAADDVRRGELGTPQPEGRSICIPTCVDYEKFTMSRGAAPDEFLTDAWIVGYIGSLNPSYAYRESLELARMILERNPRAKLLALTGQTEPMLELLDELSIPAARRLVRSVPHDEIHRWLPWIDVGLMLLVEPRRAKRASMPTKLAEFFATGVLPIAHGANSEITSWVERTGSGLALPDLTRSSLERAADFAARERREVEVLERARAIAEEHFSLASSAERYDRLFRDVLG